VERAVLFDFGGTLDADGVTWKERFARLFRTEGVRLEPARFDPLFYAADDALVRATPPTLSFGETVSGLATAHAQGLGLGGNDALVRRVASRFLEAALETLRGNTPLLSRLRGRYRLGIVSNFYGNLETVCDDAGIRELFSVIVDSCRGGRRKPHPPNLDPAVEALGLTPADATFVGDSPTRDMAGARAVGMRHIWLAGEASGTREPCCPGDRVIASLAQLEAVL
jgi:putative hydrolase of the HAD superfamily